MLDIVISGGTINYSLYFSKSIYTTINTHEISAFKDEQK